MSDQGNVVPPASHPAAQAWIDRIAWLPSADEQGRLDEAIAEANRYAGPFT
jgi:hypothetical protein